MFQILVVSNDENLITRINDSINIQNVKITHTNNLHHAKNLSMENAFNLYIIHVKSMMHFKFAEEIHTSEGLNFFIPIVFICENISYLIYAYTKLRCFDYIINPYAKDAFCKTKQYIRHYMNLSSLLFQSTNRYLVVNTSKSIIRIPYSKIIYIESSTGKTIIHTSDSETYVPYSMKSIIKLIDCSFITQCHRSYIINRENIAAIDKSGDPWLVHFNNTDKVAFISRNFRSIFKDENLNVIE